MLTGAAFTLPARARTGNTMDLIPVLQALMSPDNDLRRNTEAQFEQARTASPESHEQLSLGLCSISVNPSAEPHLRGLAAVLLRGLVTGARGEFDSMGQQGQVTIMQHLLLGLSAEMPTPVRRKICDTMSELAAELFNVDAQLWPEYMPAVLQAINSPGAPIIKEMGLEALARVMEPMMEVLRPQVTTHSHDVI